MSELTDDTFSRKEIVQKWSCMDRSAALEYAGAILAELDPLAPAPSIMLQARLKGVLYRGMLHLVKEEEKKKGLT